MLLEEISFYHLKERMASQRLLSLNIVKFYKMRMSRMTKKTRMKIITRTKKKIVTTRRIRKT